MNCILNKFRPNIQLISFIWTKNLINRSFVTNGRLERPQNLRSLVMILTGHHWSQTSFLSTSSVTTNFSNDNQYERIADKTLEHLYEEFEAIIESDGSLKDADVSLNNGVITLNLGDHGIYVINKQTPNKQIWLSSPLSGPKRYDHSNNGWIYKRDGIPLFQTLSSELSKIFRRDIKIEELIKI